MSRRPRRPDLVLSVRKPPGTAFTFRLDGDVSRLGRAPYCDACLPDASVSAEHLRFERRGDGFVVIDPGSTHGTRLAGELLTPGEPTVIGHADALSIGPYLVEVFLDAADGMTTDATSSDRLAVALSGEQAIPPDRWSIFGLDGLVAGVTRSLEKTPLVIGPGGDVPVPKLEARHCQLGVDDRGPWIEGLDGGYSLRGHSRTDRRWLQRGDVITIGPVRFQVHAPKLAPQSSRPLSGFERLALGLGLIAMALAAWALLS